MCVRKNNEPLYFWPTGIATLYVCVCLCVCICVCVCNARAEAPETTVEVFRFITFIDKTAFIHRSKNGASEGVCDRQFN